MILVLDSNIWLSAFLSPRGTSGRLFELVRLGLLDVVSTEKLWEELSRSAEYDRVRKPLERDGVWADTRLFLATRPNVRFVPSIVPVANWVTADPDDNWVVQCALTARADRIVTGDKALRALNVVESVKIVSARELLDETGIVVDWDR